MHGPEIVSTTVLQSKTKTEVKGKKISCLIIFDSSILSEPFDEGNSTITEDDLKLIYYYPSFESTILKRRRMNLIEGLMSISSLLIQKGDPIDYVKTRQNEIVIKKFNNTDLVLCMIVQQPHLIRIQAGEITEIEFLEDDIYDRYNSKVIGEIPEFLSSDFKSSIKGATYIQEEENNREPLLSILDKFIETFSLLHGNIANLERNNLIDVLEDFVPAFIDTIDLCSLSITTSMNGFYFAPVEREVQLSIINLVESIRNKFGEVSHITLLFDAHMLYSTLDSLSNKILYNYLVIHNGVAMNDKLCSNPYGRFPTSVSLEKKGGSSTFGRSNKINGDGFLFGPCLSNSDIKNRNNFVFSPKIFLPGHTKDGYKLVAFTYKELMLVLLLTSEYDNYSVEDIKKEVNETNLNESLNFCFEIRKYIINSNGGLGELYPPISNQFMSIMNLTDTCRFFYINKANFAIRRSNRLLGSTKTLMSSSEGDCVLRSTKFLTCDDDDITHFIFKSSNEGWIICRKSLDRIFYLFFEDSKIPLSKIIGKLILNNFFKNDLSVIF